MTAAAWKSLLTAWSAQLLTTDLTQHLSEGDRQLTYLGFPGAKEREIKSLEKRLGVALPPSYRTFLEVSNGFRVISPFIYRLRPAAEVDWFRVENEGWIETYNEPTFYDDPDRARPSDEVYFKYPQTAEHDFRAEHLRSMLQVSEVGDGVMLLNPEAVTPDGEWEAWFFANWIPGAERYASFAHMMVETYRSMRKLEKLPNRPKLPEVKVPGPKVRRHRIAEVTAARKEKRKVPKREKGEEELHYIARFLEDMSGEKIGEAPPELAKLLQDLKSSDKRLRAKTARILQGKLRGRPMGVRYPELVPLATELARTLEDAEGRCACIGLLTEITPDGPVPEWLVAGLRDAHAWVRGAALYAVHYFRGPELVEPILAILKGTEDFHLAQSAARALSNLRDERVIPALREQLEKEVTTPPGIPAEARERIMTMYYTQIAMELARYGPKVVDRLKTALLHTDPKRRAAAIVGLQAIGEASSRKVVAELKSDPDALVRQQAGSCDRSWGGTPGFTMHDA